MTPSIELQPSDPEIPHDCTKEDANHLSNISDDENGDEIDATGDIAKRFLPAYKKSDAAKTFPEKLMNLMRYVEKKNKIDKQFCVAWLPEGKTFVIYNTKEFSNNVVPKFFKASKFCSFTRKLYRWGFRQLNRGIGPDEPIIFGNEYFQRDNAGLMVNMRSITAAAIRKRESELLRRMLATKKRAMISLDATSNASYQNNKHLNPLLNNTSFPEPYALFVKRQQDASLASAVTAMSSRPRFGGGGYSTDVGRLDNHSLQMMYQSLTNKSAGSGDRGMAPILNEDVSRIMNNTSNYTNFHGSSDSSHDQEFNAMPSMQISNSSSQHSATMGRGPTSNYMSQMNGQNGSVTNGSNIGNGRMSNMNTLMNSVNGNFNLNNNGYSGSLNNNMFPSDTMYGNGSGNGSNDCFNLLQQYTNCGSNGDGGKRNFHSNGANHENNNYGNYTYVARSMNINQHLFDTAPTQGTTGELDESSFFGGHF